MSILIQPVVSLKGKPQIPGDKSISHRALLLGAIAKGKTEIIGLLRSDDVHSTWRTLERLGVSISEQRESVVVQGQNIQALTQPSTAVDCGNSGTTIRLLTGVLSACPFAVQLTGDASLSQRPMQRVTSPLSKMGARFELTRNHYAPLWVHGTRELRAIHYDLPVASAQVKSALLLAGIFARGETTLSGKIHSRDHTERLLSYFGASISVLPTQTISIQGGQGITGRPIMVPGDLSSAAFWIAAATLIPGSDILIENVSLNPTRMGLVHVLLRMNAKIDFEVKQSLPEPIGDLRVTYSPLQATTISPAEIPTIIDELPLIAVVASFAEGTTKVNGAEELRIKETDRIEAIAVNLRAMGGEISTFEDGFSISGPQILIGNTLNSFDDHRIAMAFSIAGLRATGNTYIENPECVNISYPTFYATLNELARGK